MVMTEQRNPGPDFCNNIARALNVPPERVFRLAGLLPPVIIGQEQEQELLNYFNYLNSYDRHTILILARALHEKHADYQLDDKRIEPE